MRASRLSGITLLVGGLVALGIAYQQSGSLGDLTRHLFTGDYSDKTTWMIVIGGVASALGLVALLLPVVRPRHTTGVATREPERVRSPLWKLRTRIRRRTWLRFRLVSHPTTGNQAS
jgi:hypothetical protein